MGTRHLYWILTGLSFVVRRSPSNLQRTPIQRNSQICFHLNRVESGKDDSLSEAHFQSSKTIRGSFLDSELYIFINIFEYYLVTQSL